MTDKIKIWLDANRGRITDEWFELLRFPSVGTAAAHLQDCKDCARWLAAWLERLGFGVSWQGADCAPPILFAERKTRGDKTLLIYGHYDVQPADPETAWQSPPFAPEIRNGRVYARGAQDNKGQIWWTLQAVRAAIECGVETPNIKIILDGQEESGSGELVKMIEKIRKCENAKTRKLENAEIRKCGNAEIRKFENFETQNSRDSVLLVADTGACADGRPALTAGLRGVSSVSFRLHGADHDLHSGTHGGVAPNPAHELARIVAEMFNPDGSIAVEGFMDAVAPPSEAEIALALATPFDERQYEATTGVAPSGGAVGTPPQIRGSLLPTIEVNGFHSGYGGEGGKTIIPAFAEVKISCRTVPNQTPAQVIGALRGHFKRRVKNGLRLEEIYAEEGACALRIGADSPYAKAALRIFGGMDPRGGAVVYEGASIHVIGALAEVSGAEPLLVGFGQDADRIHSPDESYSFGQAEMNFRFASELIAFLR